MKMSHYFPESFISGIDYKNNKLYVEFNGKNLYAYPNVPLSVYEDFVAATSKSEFFKEHIKNLPFEKINV